MLPIIIRTIVVEPTKPLLRKKPVTAIQLKDLESALSREIRMSMTRLAYGS